VDLVKILVYDMFDGSLRLQRDLQPECESGDALFDLGEVLVPVAVTIEADRVVARYDPEVAISASVYDAYRNFEQLADQTKHYGLARFVLRFAIVPPDTTAAPWPVGKHRDRRPSLSASNDSVLIRERSEDDSSIATASRVNGDYTER
jgi:hypothetical protein